MIVYPTIAVQLVLSPVRFRSPTEVVCLASFVFTVYLIDAGWHALERLSFQVRIVS